MLVTSSTANRRGSEPLLTCRGIFNPFSRLEPRPWYMKVVLLLYMVIDFLIVLNTVAPSHIVFDFALLVSFYQYKHAILIRGPTLSTCTVMSTLVEMFTTFTNPLYQRQSNAAGLLWLCSLRSLAIQLRVFKIDAVVETMIDKIADVPTLWNFASVLPVARDVFARYPRSKLAHADRSSSRCLLDRPMQPGTFCM